MPTEAAARESRNSERPWQGVEGAATTSTADDDLPHRPDERYERMSKRWKKCRMLIGGTEAVRDAGEDVLPKYKLESKQAYDARRTMAALFPAFARSVLATIDMLLQKEPTLAEDNSEEVVAFWENVDRRGTHAALFARRLGLNGTIDGFAGIFTDYPKALVSGERSFDEELRAGLRPYWLVVTAEELIKAVVETVTVNGEERQVTTLFIRRERRMTRRGRFGIRSVLHYRVYTDDGTGPQCEVWEADDAEAEPKQVEDARALAGFTEIPFSPFYAGLKVADYEAYPPLESVADLNLEYHRIKTGRESLQERAFIPTLKRVGFIPRRDPVSNEPIHEPLALGPESVIDVPIVASPDGKSGIPGDVLWFSPDVAVLEPSQKTLDMIRAEIATATHAFLNPDRRADETAEARRIDSAATNASVRTLATALKDCLELGLQHAAPLLGPGTKAGSVVVNTDFEDVRLTAQDIDARTKQLAAGGTDLGTYIDMMIEGGVFPEGTSREAVIRAILSGVGANVKEGGEPGESVGGE